MNKQRKVLITTTYNEMGIIIDTKAEEVAQPNLQPTCNNLATDTISRQDAITAIIGLPTWYYDSDRHYGDPQPPMEALLDPEDVVNAIENLPPAKQEQKTGRWIYDGEYKNGMLRMKCSICGTAIETFDGPSQLRYCQNCGAKMEDKE